jgi:hypothetical protein
MFYKDLVPSRMGVD